MENKLEKQEHQEAIRLLVVQGHDNNSIENKLLEQGMDTDSIAQLLEMAKGMRYAMRTRKGGLLVVLGVIVLGIGFLSCVIIHTTGGEIGLPLYGLTILGLSIVFAGLIYIFQ